MRLAPIPLAYRANPEMAIHYAGESSRTTHGAPAFLSFTFAGVGIDVGLVTIDTYISELVPKSIRGRAFAINQAIQFVAVPLATFLSWQLVPIDPLGIAGWRSGFL